MRPQGLPEKRAPRAEGAQRVIEHSPPTHGALVGVVRIGFQIGDGFDDLGQRAILCVCPALSSAHALALDFGHGAYR